MLSTHDDYLEAKTTLREAATAYYLAGEDGAVALSDAEYDALQDAVAAFEREHEVGSDLASEQVAAGAQVGGDVEHSSAMLSLDNVFDSDALRAFLSRTGASTFSVEPKLDGLALAIRYRQGSAVQMITRGDGTHGEDVTYALSQVTNLPSPSGFTGEVRGEVIFTHEQFAEANRARTEHGAKEFSNARNGAAGALRGAKKRDYTMPMSFFAYDVVQGLSPTSHVAAMSELEEMGFATAAALLQARSCDAQGVVAAVQEHGENRAQLPVAVDGMVIKVDALAERTRLGSGSRAPRWAVAFKFPPEQVTSVLHTIHWQVGRTGLITPRAEIDPVTVGDVQVQFATLHNPGDLARKGFMLGDTVSVVRAGEVIPRLEAPVLAARDGSQSPIEPPSTCPRCDGDIDRSQARWRCARGRACGAAESISYAVGRDCLDIEGLGKVQVGHLVAAGTLTSIADLFTLTENDLVEHGKVAGANAPKILEQVEQARTAPLARVVAALGIRGTGRSLSRTIARHFPTMRALQDASVEDLAQVDKIGPVKAALIREELTELAPVIEALRENGVAIDAAPSATPGPEGAGDSTQEGGGARALEGMSVCVTGKMSGPLGALSRNEVGELIEAHGGRAASSVSKSTSLLVANLEARTSSKAKNAQKFSVPVMTEEEFAALLGIG